MAQLICKHCGDKIHPSEIYDDFYYCDSCLDTFSVPNDEDDENVKDFLE